MPSSCWKVVPKFLSSVSKSNEPVHRTFQRGHSKLYLTVVCVWGLKPLSISEDLNPQKWQYWLFVCLFVFNFHKSGPISKGFSSSKQLISIFYFIFFFKFCRMGPSSKDFWPKKMGSISKEFWWKSTLFGWHIPIWNNMRVPTSLKCIYI